MNAADEQYLDLAEMVLEHGTVKEDRTGTGTISLFGPQISFDLSKGFPLLTTKQTAFRIILEEWLWFKNGDTNLKTLLERDVHIWDGDAYRDYLEKGGILPMEEFLEMVLHSKDGYDLGPIYGYQWREWEDNNGNTHDQLAKAIEDVKKNPDSRRIIVSSWNPGMIDYMALPPCHVFFQIYVADGKISLKMYQRSADIFLGLPFNIASYATKVYTIAKMTGLEVGQLILTFGDAHIYLNHVEQIKEQMKRTPRPLPQLTVKTVHESIDDYTFEDYELTGYDPHPRIKGAVSVGL